MRLILTLLLRISRKRYYSHLDKKGNADLRALLKNHKAEKMEKCLLSPTAVRSFRYTKVFKTVSKEALGFCDAVSVITKAGKEESELLTMIAPLGFLNNGFFYIRYL